MSAFPFSDKDFDDLNDEELAALEDHEWTSEQILAAISMALSDGAMDAVVLLLDRLRRVDVKAAAAIVAVIEAGAAR